MPLHPTACPLDCPDACGVLVETDAAGELLRVRGNPAHPYSRGTLCAKTSRYHELVRSEERLLTPLVREGAELVPASWERALGVAAERLAAVAGPEVLALQYAGSMGMLARLFPLRAMHALGATTHDSGVCDTTSTAGFEAVLGDCVGPDVLEAEEADAVVVWGSDLRRTIQHLYPLVRGRARAGAPVRVVDVWRTDTVADLERHGAQALVIRPGTDSILASALARWALETGRADRRFLAEECLGAEAYEAHLAGAPDLAEAARRCGVAEEAVRDLGEVLAGARRLFLRTGSGWARRRNGGHSMRALCSLAAVLGKADRVHYESGAVFPFDSDVVARPDLRPAPAPPVLNHVAAGPELAAGRFRAAVVWGHNPALTLPDSASVRAGLARDDLFVLVHEQVMTETARLADVVLPATFFVEHTDLYKSYGHRVAQLGRRAVAPPDGPRSNVATFAALARELGLPAPACEDDEERLVEEVIGAWAPAADPERVARLRAGEPTPFEAPAGSRQAPGARRWPTPSGKVELASERAAAAGHGLHAAWCEDPGTGAGRALWLVAAPSVDTHNTTYLDHERHARRAGEPCCFVHPDEAAARGLAEGAAVTLTSDRGRLTLRLALDARTPAGCVRVDGFPRPSRTPEGASINELTGPELSDLGDGVTYYSTRVDLVAAGG
jgi:anaerobic selenocysteine-containing dehydrogenase